MADLIDIPFNNSSGNSTTLGSFKGKVVLVVNVASKCGLTPQYEGLEAIYEKYNQQGFTVVAFPANEFGAQEPGSNEEIQSFCQMNFGVKFPVMQKIVVKGEGQHPLFETLTKAQPKAFKNTNSELEEKLRGYGLLSGGPSDILWNFEKFLIGRDGKVIKRFAPDVTPQDPTLITAIETELKKAV